MKCSFCGEELVIEIDAHSAWVVASGLSFTVYYEINATCETCDDVGCSIGGEYSVDLVESHVRKELEELEELIREAE